MYETGQAVAFVPPPVGLAASRTRPGYRRAVCRLLACGGPLGLGRAVRPPRAVPTLVAPGHVPGLQPQLGPYPPATRVGQARVPGAPCGAPCSTKFAVLVPVCKVP